MRRYLRPAIAFTITGGLVGAIAGAFLGALGMLVPGLQVVGWIGLAVLAIGLFFELLGRRLPMLNRDAETPRAWIDQGWLRWAVKNGAALSLGVTTRLGFPVWYAIPAICLLGASPVIGALTWGLYGLLRTGLSVTAGVRQVGPGGLGGRGSAERLLDLRHHSRLLSSALGAAICLALVIALG
jgi:hypothetical protein